MTECKPSDLVCLLQNKGILIYIIFFLIIQLLFQTDLFSQNRQPEEDLFVESSANAMYCPCLPSCSALDYEVYVSHFPHMK